MRLPTPRWWYERGRRRGSTTRLLLTPIAAIWAGVTANRIARTHPFDPGVPVIYVGGLTLGGTGKTPVAREILNRLKARGVAAHALSRGYGGRRSGPLRVDPAHQAASEVGDEPLMLARDHPTWIPADRRAGAAAAVAAGAGAIVMDDGHQNPALKKTLSLVVIDGETRDGEWPFGDGAVPLSAGSTSDSRLDFGGFGRLSGARTITMFRPSNRASASTLAEPSTCSTILSRIFLPSSGWKTSLPRNMIVILTL